MNDYTQNDLIAVRDAIKNGLRAVTLEDGRQMTFRSLNELIAIEGRIQKSLSNDTRFRRSGYQVRVSKGL